MAQAPDEHYRTVLYFLHADDGNVASEELLPENFLGAQNLLAPVAPAGPFAELFVHPGDVAFLGGKKAVPVVMALDIRRNIFQRPVVNVVFFAAPVTPDEVTATPEEPGQDEILPHY